MHELKKYGGVAHDDGDGEFDENRKRKACLFRYTSDDVNGILNGTNMYKKQRISINVESFCLSYYAPYPADKGIISRKVNYALERLWKGSCHILISSLRHA